MADKTGIEWTDATWNPTTGCDRVSPGCDHCYALTMAGRLKAMGSAKYQRDGNPATSGPGFGVSVHPDSLGQPLRWSRSRRIFVNSMSDLFHAEIPDEFIARVFAVMALANWHVFQVLTKRHARMRSLLSSSEFADMLVHAHERLTTPLMASGRWENHLDRHPLAWPLPNVWLGVSVENQQWADIRIPHLLDTPAAIRWLSCEPLLGPVRLPLIEEHDTCTCGTGPGGYYGQHERGCGTSPGPAWGNLHWVVVGGESGKDARPMHPDWARQLRDECQMAGVPFLFKQAGEVLAREWGCKHHKGGDPDEWRVPFPREYPAVTS